MHTYPLARFPTGDNAFVVAVGRRERTNASYTPQSFPPLDPCFDAIVVTPYCNSVQRTPETLFSTISRCWFYHCVSHVCRLSACNTNTEKNYFQQINRDIILSSCDIHMRCDLSFKKTKSFNTELTNIAVITNRSETARDKKK